MTFSGLALLWLVLGVGCVVLGTLLTRRRALKVSLQTRVPRRATRGREIRARQGRIPKTSPQAIPLRAVRERRDDRERAVCARCAQPLETGARFCGACGLYVHGVLHEQSTRAKVVKRARA